jgi:dUTP pyrophosphatase
MMQSLLHSANLGPEYWSWALLHAVYLKNRLPHRATNTTPYHAYTGQKPSIKKIRIFGCPIVARLPGKHPAKLDTHAKMGIFLGYTATEHNIYYQDCITKKIKIASHVSFDEAGYTIPQAALSMTQQRLQSRNHTNKLQSKGLNMDIDISQQNIPTEECENNTLKVCKLTNHATIPTRASNESVGYDLYSATEITIAPRTMEKIPTDIAVTPPPGTYCQILSRSGLITKHNIEVKAGTIDRDYTGNVTVVLQNNSDKPFIIHQGN